MWQPVILKWWINKEKKNNKSRGKNIAFFGSVFVFFLKINEIVGELAKVTVWISAEKTSNFLSE